MDSGMDSGAYGLLAGMVFVLAVVAVGMLLSVTWRRALRGPGNAIAMHRVLEQQGRRPVSYVGDASAHALAIAARRCVLCASGAECKAYLDAGDRASLENLCPNAAAMLRRD